MAQRLAWTDLLRRSAFVWVFGVKTKTFTRRGRPSACGSGSVNEPTSSCNSSPGFSKLETEHVRVYHRVNE